MFQNQVNASVQIQIRACTSCCFNQTLSSFSKLAKNQQSIAIVRCKSCLDFHSP